MRADRAPGHAGTAPLARRAAASRAAAASDGGNCARETSRSASDARSKATPATLRRDEGSASEVAEGAEEVG